MKSRLRRDLCPKDSFGVALLELTMNAIKDYFYDFELINLRISFVPSR
jgi:hypothetical protein